MWTAIDKSDNTIVSSLNGIFDSSKTSQSKKSCELPSGSEWITQCLLKESPVPGRNTILANEANVFVNEPLLSDNQNGISGVLFKRIRRVLPLAIDYYKERIQNIPLDQIPKINPEFFSMLSARQLNAWAIQARNGEMGNNKSKNSWPVNSLQHTSKEQLQRIPKNVIPILSPQFWETLSELRTDKVKEMHQSQLAVITKEVLLEVAKKNYAFMLALIEKNVITETQFNEWQQHSISTVTKRKRDVSDVEKEPQNSKLPRKRNLVVVALEAERETGEQKREREKATENYRQKERGGHITDEYKIIVRSNGGKLIYKYHSGAHEYRAVEKFPKEMSHVDQLVVIGHAEDGQMAGLPPEELAIKFRQLFNKIKYIDTINLEGCQLTGRFQSDFLKKFVTKERDVIAGGSSLIIDERFANVKVSVPLFPLDIAGSAAEGADGTLIQAGVRLYEKNRELLHYTSETRLVMRLNPDNPSELFSSLSQAKADGEKKGARAPEHGGPFGNIGPFDYARYQQKLNKTSQIVASWGEGMRKVRQHVMGSVERSFYQEDSELVVVIPKLKKEGEKFLVSVVNSKTQMSRKIEVPQKLAEEILANQEQSKRTTETLRDLLERRPDGSLRIKEGFKSREGHPDGSINVAFFIMALLSAVKGEKLSAEEKLSLYWNLGGMNVAVGRDGVEIGKVVSELMESGAAVERTLEILGRIFEGANLVVMVGSVGFNVYELATTKDSVKRMGLAVGLGFNLAAIGVQGSSMLVSGLFPAAAETAVAFGPMAVPLIGLGFGFSALGEQIADNNKKTHDFYQYFAHIFDIVDHKKVYTKKNHIDISDNIISLEKVNFRNGTITAAEIKLVESYKEKGFFAWAFGAAPTHTYIPGVGYHYFNVLKNRNTEFDTEGNIFSLSNTPPVKIFTKFIDAATGLSTEEQDAENRIKEAATASRSDAELQNSWHNLKPQAEVTYLEGTQEVLLDGKRRTLLFRSENNHPQAIGKLRHMVEGGGGDYILQGLNSGVKLTLKDGEAGPSTYRMNISKEELLGENDVRWIISGNQKTLEIQCKSGRIIKIDVSGLNPDSKLTVIGAEKIGREVNVSSGKIQINTLDLREGIQDVSSYLDGMAKKGKLADLVSVVQGPAVPTPLKADASEEEKTAYLSKVKEVEKLAIRIAYDSKNRRFIIPGKHYSIFPLDSLQGNEARSPWLGTRLVGVTEEQAFFFDPIQRRLIRTDRSKNKEIASYELRFGNSESRIEGVIQMKEQIVMKQVVPLAVGKEVNLLYLLKEDKCELVEICGLDSARLKRFMNFSDDFLTDMKAVKNEGSESDKGHNNMEVFARQLCLEDGEEFPLTSLLKKSELSEWVKIEGTDSKGNSQTMFFHMENGYSVRLNAVKKDMVLIKSWPYPSLTGGMGLLLWSPKTQIANFVKLLPGYFNPARIYSKVGREKKLIYGINPPAKFHKLANKEMVVPFVEGDMVYLVTPDGKKITIVDNYGAQTSTQYDVAIDSESDFEEERALLPVQPIRYERV